MEFAIENGCVKDGSPKRIAKFLKTVGLSKFAVGQYLGNKKTDAAVIQAYIDQFAFSGKALDIDMRAFLNLFRLPMEG